MRKWLSYHKSFLICVAYIQYIYISNPNHNRDSCLNITNWRQVTHWNFLLECYLLWLFIYQCLTHIITFSGIKTILHLRNNNYYSEWHLYSQRKLCRKHFSGEDKWSLRYFSLMVFFSGPWKRNCALLAPSLRALIVLSFLFQSHVHRVLGPPTDNNSPKLWQTILSKLMEDIM